MAQMCFLDYKTNFPEITLARFEKLGSSNGSSGLVSITSEALSEKKDLALSFANFTRQCLLSE